MFVVDSVGVGGNSKRSLGWLSETLRFSEIWVFAIEGEKGHLVAAWSANKNHTYSLLILIFPKTSLPDMLSRRLVGGLPAPPRLSKCVNIHWKYEIKLANECFRITLRSANASEKAVRSEGLENKIR